MRGCRSQNGLVVVCSHGRGRGRRGGGIALRTRRHRPRRHGGASQDGRVVVAGDANVSVGLRQGVGLHGREDAVQVISVEP